MNRPNLVNTSWSLPFIRRCLRMLKASKSYLLRWHIMSAAAGYWLIKEWAQGTLHDIAQWPYATLADIEAAMPGILDSLQA